MKLQSTSTSMKCFLVFSAILSLTSCSLLTGGRHHSKNYDSVIIRTDIEKHITVFKPTEKNRKGQEDSYSDEIEQRKSASTRTWTNSDLDLNYFQNQNPQELWEMNENIIPEWKIDKSPEIRNWMESTTERLNLPSEMDENTNWKSVDWIKSETGDIDDFSADNDWMGPKTKDQFPWWLTNKKMPSKMDNTIESTNTEGTDLKNQDIDDFSTPYQIIMLNQKKNLDEVTTQNVFRVSEMNQMPEWHLNQNWMEPKAQDIDDFSVLNESPMWGINKNLAINKAPIEDRTGSSTQDIDDFSPINEFLRWKMNRDVAISEYSPKNQDASLKINTDDWMKPQIQKLIENPSTDQVLWWQIKNSKAFNEWNAPRPQTEYESSMANQIPLWKLYKNLSVKSWNNAIGEDLDGTKKPWRFLFQKSTKSNFIPWWRLKESKMDTKLSDSTNTDYMEDPTEINNVPWWKKKKMGMWWMINKSSPWTSNISVKNF